MVFSGGNVDRFAFDEGDGVGRGEVTGEAGVGEKTAVIVSVLSSAIACYQDICCYFGIPNASRTVSQEGAIAYCCGGTN